MGAGKGKTKRRSTLYNKSALHRVNQVLIRGEAEERRSRNGLGRYATISYGSHGRAFASGKLTLNDNGENVILLGGRESTLSHALLNGGIFGKEVDFFVQAASGTGELVEEVIWKTKKIKLQGKLEEDTEGYLLVGGVNVISLLKEKRFLGRVVDFIIFPKDEFFMEEKEVVQEELIF